MEFLSVHKNPAIQFQIVFPDNDYDDTLAHSHIRTLAYTNTCYSHIRAFAYTNKCYANMKNAPPSLQSSGSASFPQDIDRKMPTREWRGATLKKKEGQ